MCNQIVEVMTLGARQRVFPGILQNTSPSGLCLLLKRRLPKDATIATIVGDELIVGSVRYAVRGPEGVRTGVQIRCSTRRSEAAQTLEQSVTLAEFDVHKL